MTGFRFRVFSCVFIFVITLMPVLVAGQRVTSDVLGTLTDPSGAVVPHARITLRRPETGEQRETTSAMNGRYRFVGLSAGNYEIQFESPGFRTGVLTAVELLVNQQAVVDWKFEIGEVRETVRVVAQSSFLDAASPASSAVVTRQTLEGLPLNGRDLSQLILLQPGVLSVTSAGPSPFTEGGTSKIAVAGARPSMNNYTLDGADMNDPAYNTPPGGVAGAQLGAAAIQEFRVQLNNYSAEFGRNAGANVQYITSSGGNAFHGSLFEFFRNAALDSRNFFEQDKAPFTRNQFGGTLGGRIAKNKTFFFVNVESLRERKSIVAMPLVPDANARRGVLPSATNPTTLVDVGIDRRVAPFVDLYPSAGTMPVGGGLALSRTSQRQPTNEDYFLLRIDHAPTAHDQLSGRYVFDGSHSMVPYANTNVPGFPSKREVRNEYLMVNWQRFADEKIWNEAKVSFSRVYLSTREAYVSPVSISLSPNRPLGGINIPGLSQLGSSLLSPVAGPSNTFEVIDNLSYQHSDHTIKTGVDLKRIQINGKFDSLVNGAYFFGDLEPFGLPAQSANPALEFFLKGIPFLYLGVDPVLADSNRGYRQTYAGLYAQDDWRISDRLLLNLGIRWEYWSNPSEAHGRVANIRNLMTDTRPTVGSIWASVPRDLWSPRLGFAWRPSAGARTVIRGGAGIMRDQLWANLYDTTRFYEPFFRALQYVLPNFQPSPQNVQSLIGFGGPPSVLGIFGMTYQPDFPYYAQYNLNVQRQLPGGFRVQVGYVGSRGIHLVRAGEANPFRPQLNRRLNPSFGSTIQIVTDGQSNYNAGQLSFERRFSRGLSAGASYTYSKSIDDQSGTFPSDFTSDAGLAQNFFDRKVDRARSAFDRTHAFALHYLYELPLGWSVGGIITLMSGPPFSANLGSYNNSATQAITSADRPDLKPNVSTCEATNGDPNRWFDPVIFTLPAPGRFGNAGRNIMCGPPLKNFDFSLAKIFAFREQTKLQFRTEFFNLFNHPNFDVPVNTQGPAGSGGNGDAIFIGRRRGSCNPVSDSLGCGVPAPGAARIFRTVTTSRQIQFALRLKF